jgi:hypothetical protein
VEEPQAVDETITATAETPAQLAKPAAPPPARSTAPEAPRPSAADRRAEPFVSQEQDRQSTFVFDVSADSYRLGRRYLQEGRLPPPGTVRVQGWVNSFSYGDRAPERGDFSLRAEGAPTPFTSGERRRLLRFSLHAREAARRDLAGTPQPVARDAQVQVEFNPGAVAVYRLLGDAAPGAAGDRPRGGSAGGEEIGAGRQVTALYEVELRPDARPSQPLATLHLRYRSPETGRMEETERTLWGRDLAPSWDQAPPSLRLAAVVAELAEILRSTSPGTGASPKTKDAHVADVLRRAREVAAAFSGTGEGARVDELADLVERALQPGSGPSRE